MHIIGLSTISSTKF